METFPALALAALLIVLIAFLFITLSGSPPLPGPYFRDYLPGGLMFSLYKDARLGFEVLTKLRDVHGDVFQIWLGPIRVINTAVREDVLHVLSTSAVFERAESLRTCTGTLAPGCLFSMKDRSIHDSARLFLREKFNHSMLENFHSKIIDAVTELCESLRQESSKGPVYISEYLATTTFRVITNVAFGSDMSKEDRFGFNASVDELVSELMTELFGYPIRQWLTRFGVRRNFFRCITKIRATCLTFIERRLSENEKQQKSRTPDMLDAILELCDEDATLATSLVIEFAVAGSHTTNHQVHHTVFELCCNPRVAEKLQKELDITLGHKPLSEQITVEDMKKLSYTRQVWMESLRRRPIGPFLMRTANRDVTLEGSGIKLKKGSTVIALPGLSQLDPRVWREPLEFKPERWSERKNGERDSALPGSYMPFGVGQLSCAGRFLADYEGPLIIAELYRRFSFELDCGVEDVVMQSSFTEAATCVRGNKETFVPYKVTVREGMAVT